VPSFCGSPDWVCARCLGCRRRPTSGTANPRGGDDPYVSPEGHNIIDVKFEGTFKLFGEEQPYAMMLEEMANIPGIVTHGMLLGLADAVVVAKAGGPDLVELKKRA
jgi:ribose 5-phosphate isomerase A